ncbi:uncharacterized protein K452DRAFT_69852 [Aplosporella prunicola CBS 121167]|uniref:Uncharacterized protein n=1 Tax=Aplosporella prunicola CBS 121167 TaxID=1176127 RepID=A0A6A6BSF4_9PEZI|nr:uncharacterized protein K452DRAFT_69852 [Aplosporella prunicola CBS 121167]KAF2146728.1 hypothetical protein K452DRAFT_69852 [Aplosporella prunicola CBS 121167]
MAWRALALCPAQLFALRSLASANGHAKISRGQRRGETHGRAPNTHSYLQPTAVRVRGQGQGRAWQVRAAKRQAGMIPLPARPQQQAATTTTTTKTPNPTTATTTAARPPSPRRRRARASWRGAHTRHAFAAPPRRACVRARGARPFCISLVRAPPPLSTVASCVPACLHAAARSSLAS